MRCTSLRDEWPTASGIDRCPGRRPTAPPAVSAEIGVSCSPSESNRATGRARRNYGSVALLVVRDVDGDDLSHPSDQQRELDGVAANSAVGVIALLVSVHKADDGRRLAHAEGAYGAVRPRST